MKVKKVQLLSFFFLLFLLEAGLRFQQHVHPFFDLEMRGVTFDTLSGTVNHKNLSDPARGRYYDQDGVEMNPFQAQYPEGTRIFKILCVGDSFVEGYDTKNAPPYHIQRYLETTSLEHTPLQVINAGTSSYSPAIYVPFVKQIIPKIRPDFVLVDIDETDLGDDYLRYRFLIERDESDSIARVKPTPIFYQQTAGYLKIKKNPSYLIRFVLKLYHYYVYMPIITKQYRKQTGDRHVLSYSWDKAEDAREKYAEEIDFFEGNLDDLARTLVRLMGTPKRVIFIYHPHLQHLKPDSNGHYWNHFVSEAVGKIASVHRIPFYDVTLDFKRSTQGEPEKYFKPHDMHFNFEGIEIYGALLGKKIFPLIQSLASIQTDEGLTELP